MKGKTEKKQNITITKERGEGKGSVSGEINSVRPKLQQMSVKLE